MKILLLTIGFAVLLGGVGGAAYCITMLYEGTAECASVAQNLEALNSAQKQYDQAKNTPAGAKLAERLQTIKYLVRSSEANCSESIFRYRAFTAVAGISTFLGSLLLGIGKLLHRNKHFGFGFGDLVA